MKKSWSLLLLLLLVVALAACRLTRVDVGSLQEVTETVERQDAQDARITVVMGAGELNIGAGSANLMEAEFTYNVEEWVPEVSYEVSDGTGILEVRQPEMEETVGIPTGAITNRWDLTFSDALPLVMHVTLGAGENQLSLADLDVRSLSLEAGAGEVTVDLGGSLEELDVEAGVGDLQINLSAEGRTASLDGTIQGGVGSTTVVLPDDVGVRVQVQQGLGSVNAAGFNQDGDVYTNDAYEESEVSIDLRIDSGVGEVTLQLAD
jgi:hypothetical protein